MNTLPDSKIIMIIVGSEGFIGSRFLNHVYNLRPEKIFLIDPKLKTKNSAYFPKKVSLNLTLKACLASINLYFRSNNSLSTRYKIIIANFGGISRKGTYKNDFYESSKFNTNLEVIVDVCRLVSKLLNLNQIQKILILHISSNGLVDKNQLSGYEYSKFAQENILQTFTSSIKENRVYLIVVRLSDVYGDTNYHKDKVVNLIVKNAKLRQRVPYLRNQINYNPIHIAFIIFNLVQQVSDFLDEKCKLQIIRYKYKPKVVFKLTPIQKFALSIHKGNFELFLVFAYVFTIAKLRFYLKVIQSKFNFLHHKQKSEDTDFFVLYDKTNFLSWMKKEILNG